MHRSLAFVLAASLLVPSPAMASRKSWSTASDIGVWSLTAVSLGLPAIRKDKNGVLQAAGSLVATSLVTEGLKQAFPKTRPDGSDRKSFPSAHTSRAFSAAATIYNREGAAYGIPAFAVAAFTGVARHEAKKHFWVDVAAGAALGTATGFLITNKRPDAQTALVPWGDSHGAGIDFAMRF